MLKDIDVQGMFVVEGAAALRQLAERWRQKSTWAFQVLHAPAEPASRGLVLPPPPGEPRLDTFLAPLAGFACVGVLHVR